MQSITRLLNLASGNGTNDPPGHRRSTTDLDSLNFNSIEIEKKIIPSRQRRRIRSQIRVQNATKFTDAQRI